MTSNFLGIPIDGDITAAEKRASQWPQEKLEEAIKALLDDETFTEFGWRQYTPYFNDGEPCIFHATAVWFRSQTAPPDKDEFPTEWSSETERFELWNNKSLAGESLRRAKAVETAVEGGHFDDVLLNLFGDHAIVTVRRTGISISFYSHE